MVLINVNEQVKRDFIKIQLITKLDLDGNGIKYLTLFNDHIIISPTYRFTHAIFNGDHHKSFSQFQRDGAG